MSSAFEGLPKTPNLKLNKPGYNNVADIEALNENADILDEEIQGIKNTFVKSVNGINAGDDGNVDLGIIPISQGGTGANNASEACANLGAVRSVNGNTADSNGNVEIDSGIPVGFEYFSTNPNIPAGSIPLFGGEYSRTTYKDLWEWVQTQAGYLLTEEEWQAKASANDGNVPFYSTGDGSTTFRVPSLKCWVKGTNGVEEVGSYLSAGLPNITGEFTDSIYTLAGAAGQGGRGAITYTKEELANVGGGNATIRYIYPVVFNASLSNGIYGNSDTVQPKSIVGMWLVKAYGTVTNVGSTDVSAIAVGLTELETRASEHANKDLSNLSDTGKNAKMLDYSSAITVSAFPFTAPCNGVFMASFVTYANSGNAVYINNVIVYISEGIQNDSVSDWCGLPMCKNDILTYQKGNETNKIKSTIFVPYYGG